MSTAVVLLCAIWASAASVIAVCLYKERQARRWRKRIARAHEPRPFRAQD